VAFHQARLIGPDPGLFERVSAASAGLPPGSTPRHTTLEGTRLRERFGIEVPDALAVIDAVSETCS
jgi:hypothetical protein